MKIDYVDINKYDPKDSIEYFGGYNIKAWFKYNKHYYKGFGYFVEFKKANGFVRYSPETSTMRRN